MTDFSIVGPSELAPEKEDPLDLDGAECERRVTETEPWPKWSILGEAEIARLDAACQGDVQTSLRALMHLYTSSAFFSPGGDWGGTVAPALRGLRIAFNNRLRIIATKEQRPTRPGSDHDVDCVNAFAADVSDGRWLTPAMDRTARQIAAAAGIPDYRYGFRQCVDRRYRMRLQLIYRYSHHNNHVHMGFRRV